jgi:hypothetical protein
MSKREDCRNCGAKLRHDKTSDQYDPEYCSGKCRKADGSEPYIKTPEEQAMVVEVKKKKKVASLDDYRKNVPSRYARRHEAEKLNWSGNEMNEEELAQAGFRANRKPIPGDWDYQEEAVEPAKPQTEYQLLCAKAKELGIKTVGKKREVIEAEIKEKENV